MSDESAPTSQPKPAPRRSRWRWPLRALIAVVLLLVLVVIVVQAVLWSTIPRSLVVAELQKALGVQVDAESVETGWFGTTRVEGVRMTIPLEDEPFVEAPAVDVEHNSLLALVLWGLQIESVEIENPVVHLRQSPSGRWNVADLMENLARQRAAGPTPAPGPQERPAIPAVAIDNARLTVTDSSGKTNEVGPLTIVGRPDETAPDLVWIYDLKLNDDVTRQSLVHVAGRVATGGDWRHDAKINVQDLDPLLSPFVGDVPDVTLDARWDGRAGGGVQGTLAIARATVSAGDQNFVARGTVGVDQAGGQVTVRPEGLELLDDQNRPISQVTQGVIRYDTGAINVDQLRLRGPGLVADVNGQYAPDAMSGELAASWTASAAPDALTHEGKLTARLTRTLDDRVEITAGVDTSGYVDGKPERNWKGRIELTAAGPRLNQLQATVTAPQLALNGPRRDLKLDGLVANLLVSEELGAAPGGETQRNDPGIGIALQSLRLGDTDQLSGTGFFLPDSGLWGLNFAGKNLPIPGLSPDALAVELEATGIGADKVNVEELQLAAEETVLRAAGSYLAKQPEPLSLKWELNHVPPETAVEAQAAGAKRTEPELFAGRLAADGEVVGTLDPLNLRMEGSLQGMNVRVLDRDLGNISANVMGIAKDDRIQIWRNEEAAPLSVLGGQWTFEAFHSLAEDATTINIGVEGLPLKEVSDFTEGVELTGTARGSWSVYLPMYSDGPNQIRAGGKLEARQITVNGYELDSVDAWTGVEKGRVTVPLEVRRLEGVLTATPGAALDNLLSDGAKRIEIEDVRAEDWPVAVPPNTFLTVDASSPRIAAVLPEDGASGGLLGGLRFESGPIAAQSAVRIGDVDAGTVRLNAQLDGRTVRVTRASSDLFGSQTDAQATVYIDEPNRTTASLTARDIDPAALSRLVPGLRALTGSLDFEASLSPSTDPRAPSPLTFVAALNSRDVYWQPVITEATTPTSGVRVGNGQFRGFVELDSYFQPKRATLADQPGTAGALSEECPPRPGRGLPVNTMQLAGGELQFWGRMVRNEDDRGQQGLTTISSHLRLGFRCLSLNQLLQAFDPDDKPVPGLVDGELVLYGTTNLPRGPEGRPRAIDETLLTRLLLASQGNGSFELKRSDLGNIGAIAFLYNALRIGQDVRQPTGNGDLAFRIENGNAFIEAFRYFNRGAEIRGVGEVRDLYELRDATIDATLYGSVRTLKDLELPIVRSVIPDLEAVASALQQGGTSIQVTGKITDPQIRPVVFGEVGRSLRELLLGDYRDANRRR